MAVWSLTPFFDELDILEIRLNVLDDVVDYHVIAESPVTHSGKPKPLFFRENAHRFAKWKDKIRYRLVEVPSGLDDWQREKRQRRCLWHAFDGEPSDIILLSDLDEIPHPDAVASAYWNILLCNMHVAKLNWRWVGPPHESWSICRMFPAAAIGRDYKDLEEARLTHMEPTGPPGWHLSWMNDPQYKLESFVHQELVPHADLAGALEGKPLFPEVVKQELEWTDDLPDYVLANKERYAHMMVTS